MTDPLLHAWLLDIATRPSAGWPLYALADWLEERGDARAAAVRNQAVTPVRVARDTAIGRAVAAGLRPVFDVERERRARPRLLGLFPEVTLTGPCPRHEPLPGGATLALTGGFRPRRRVTLVGGDCPYCRGSVRTAPAPRWPCGPGTPLRLLLAGHRVTAEVAPGLDIHAANAGPDPWQVSVPHGLDLADIFDRHAAP